MSAPPFKADVIARRLAACALVLWLAGVGCFFGCEMSASATPADERQAGPQADSCPAFAVHDCCHKAGGGKAEDGVGAATIRQPLKERTRIACCPLAGQSADPTRKVNVADAPVAEAGRKPTPTPNTLTPAQTSTPWLRVPDRGSTHLRCCVFLI